MTLPVEADAAVLTAAGRMILPDAVHVKEALEARAVHAAVLARLRGVLVQALAFGVLRAAGTRRLNQHVVLAVGDLRREATTTLTATEVLLIRHGSDLALGRELDTVLIFAVGHAIEVAVDAVLARRDAVVAGRGETTVLIPAGFFVLADVAVHRAPVHVLLGEAGGVAVHVGLGHAPTPVQFDVEAMSLELLHLYRAPRGAGEILLPPTVTDAGTLDPPVVVGVADGRGIGRDRGHRRRRDLDAAGCEALVDEKPERDDDSHDTDRGDAGSEMTSLRIHIRIPRGIAPERVGELLLPCP